MLPLQGVRVIEQTSEEFALIGRTLGELGADVIRVVSVEEITSPTAATSVLTSAWLAAAGKQRLALDLANPAGRSTLRRLGTAADIWILTHAGASIDMTRDILSQARAANRALVALSITDFGDGCSPRWQATDAVLLALTGCLARSGVKGRPPLLPPYGIAIQCAAMQALYLLLLAYLNRSNNGIGDHVRVSQVDLVAQSLDPAYGIAGTASANQPSNPATRGRPDVPQQYPIIPCRDGLVRICLLSRRQWTGMFEWMGKPAEFSDPSFTKLYRRLASRSLVQRIAELFRDYTRAELEAIGHQRGVPVAALREPLEFVRSAHVRKCQAFAPAEIAPGVISLVPNGLLTIDDCRAGMRDGYIARDHPGIDVVQWPQRRDRHHPSQGRSIRDARLPLQGIRVLDLGNIVVGAEQGRLLADYGAEVIKIESSGFPDGSRQTPDGSQMSRSFAAGNRNKKSFAVDLRTREGRELFLRLAARSDVVLANFRPGVLKSLCLSDDILLSTNPRLVIGHSSAYGSTGPWNDRRGYGPIVRSAAGLTSAWRYSDDPTAFGDTTTVYPDHASARLLIAGVLSLLVRRKLTGVGGTVELSQADLVVNLFANIVAMQSARPEQAASEVLHPSDAPWGVFPCAGEDEWCVVTVSNDFQWRALCAVIDRRDLLEHANLRSSAGRIIQREHLEACLVNWLSIRTPEEAMHLLQEAGVPAGAMLRCADLPSFFHFKRGALFSPFRQRGLSEPFLVDNLHVQSENFRAPPLQSAPYIGEHTTLLARELLKLSPAEIDDLAARKIIEAFAGIGEQRNDPS